MEHNTHYTAGQRDKRNGYYDKWYRYNAKDCGVSYNNGWRSVNTECENITIIECSDNIIY